jgi:hypothetical protein
MLLQELAGDLLALRAAAHLGAERLLPAGESAPGLAGLAAELRAAELLAAELAAPDTAARRAAEAATAKAAAEALRLELLLFVPWLFKCSHV